MFISRCVRQRVRLLAAGAGRENTRNHKWQRLTPSPSSSCATFPESRTPVAADGAYAGTVAALQLLQTARPAAFIQYEFSVTGNVMMNTNLRLSTVVLAGCLALSLPSQAGHTIVSTDSSAGLKAISDYLFYTIGGGSVISPPPGHNNMEKLSIGVGWSSDLMCGNFDISTTVKNQLNGLTDGFRNLMSNVISSATGAVASLPAMVIQRANPGLYELLTNGVLQANVAFDKAQLNCQKMSEKMADFAYSGQWTKAAAGEAFKEIVSATPDAVAAGKTE